MKNVTVCKKMCSTCPWRDENKHQLILDTVIDMFKSTTVSPCHQELAKISGDPESGVELYVEHVDTFVVCRGLAEARLQTNAQVDRVWAKVYGDLI